jgi:YDG domain/MBG domain (YGX type)
LSNTTTTTAANITPLAVTVSATGTDKVYDGTALDAVTLASGGVLAGDQVSFTDGSATFASKNVGNGKTVSVTGITVGGTDGGDYTVNANATTTANITPATLTESATPVTVAGGKVPALTGTVSGFVPGDSLADATTGTLAWSTDAPPYPTLGVYPIDGSGLSAANYVVVQAPSNAYSLKVTAMPETAATQRVYGLLGVPLTPPRIATPYGVGSSNEDSNNTGNERQDPDPAESNRRLTDFTGRLALTVVDGGVRLPTEAARSGVEQ